ncbi:hypothetical protein WMF28_43285 [Sorangium sp. So ce590]|uniref:hypothetical protein n=1 Tax=Sorangium sp. So ce590 TaxID=3133317 RepID=UPI003F5F32D2
MREQLLCQPLPPPPAGLDVKPPWTRPSWHGRVRPAGPARPPGAWQATRRAPICLEFCYPAYPPPASRAGRKPRTPQ